MCLFVCVGVCVCVFVCVCVGVCVCTCVWRKTNCVRGGGVDFGWCSWEGSCVGLLVVYFLPFPHTLGRRGFFKKSGH